MAFAMKKLYLINPLLLLICIACNDPDRVSAGIKMTSIPVWESSDMYYATGGALIDMDGDGYLELIASNGNDMANDPENAYRNISGNLQDLPYWVSSDADCSGHMAVGDINGDGFHDLVVGYYGCSPAFSPGPEKMYRGLFGGNFELMPSWSTTDVNNTFGMALGDVDGDGDLDLAVANGEVYSSVSQQNEIYFNVLGSLETDPGWISTESELSYDCAWGDVDQDGDLDLVVANQDSPHRLYYNIGGTLETSASWSTTDIDGGNSVAWGDVDNDGDLDLAVATIASGSALTRVLPRSKTKASLADGKFLLYENTGGTLSTSPVWTSDITGYCSTVAFADIDHDGDLDLAGGLWWDGVYIFENHGGSLDTASAWEVDLPYKSVAEKIMFGDIDLDGIYTRTARFDGDGVRTLYYLPEAPIHDINSVNVNGSTLGTNEFCWDRVSGWISLGVIPSATPDSLVVEYRASSDLDMVVTNWDPTFGNFMFENLNAPHVSATRFGFIILILLPFGLIRKK